MPQAFSTRLSEETRKERITEQLFQNRSMYTFVCLNIWSSVVANMYVALQHDVHVCVNVILEHYTPCLNMIQTQHVVPPEKDIH